MNMKFFRLFIIAFLMIAIAGGSGCSSELPPVMTATQEIFKPPVRKRTGDNSYYFYIESQLQRRRGNIHQAGALLERAIEKDPQSVFLKKELITLLLQQKESAKALDLVHSLLKNDPEDVDALMLLGRIQQTRGELQAAIEGYERVLKIDPKKRNIYLLLGGLYVKIEEYDKALKVYDKLVAHFPNFFAGHFFRGKLLAEQKKIDAAIAAFNETLEQNSKLLEPRFELLRLYEARSTSENEEDSERIIELYQQILENDPGNVRATLGLGYFYHRIGKTEASSNLLTDLGARSLSDQQVIRTLVQHYLEQKRFDASIIVVTGMLEGAPKSSELNYLAGLAHEGTERSEKALAFFEKVQPGSLFYSNVAIHIAFIYQDMEKIEKAIAHMEKVRREDPENAEFALYLGSFYEQADRYADGEKVLLEGLALEPNNPRLHFRLGVVYDKWDRKEKCIASMKRVIELDPKHANALNYLGYTYADLGKNLEQAEAYIKKALALRPDDGYITDSLGWVFFRKGDYAQALKHLMRASQLVPEDPVIQEHVGDAYRELEKHEDALEYYRRSLELKKKSEQEGLIRKIQEVENLQR